MRRTRLAIVTLCLMFGWSSLTQASIVIGGTRVIYPENQREVSVALNNSGDTPSLVQAWVDEGDASVSPDDSAAPFVIFPPISRVEPDAGQTLRLVFSGEGSLPADRESLFWLNVLDIPPRPQAGEEGSRNFMQLAFRSRIKLFYRPASLEGRASGAPEQLRWRVAGGELRVDNPTPYHVNLSGLIVGGREVDIGEGLIPPRGSTTYPLPAGVSSPRQGELTFINDYGGRATREFSF
ncbi:molecular chaperone [Halomonas urumqiensis]|uniref:Pilus assembly protein PapD n=1 Tax=Halomonas urumqiensis TaxID=1684789 RepID=A0A2N7UGZ4_9GAMM|nr:fimbria/pilus periplasmic chaperone [Halomonas urumqiensis]PMR79692.1 pilus assembly protein PapD [Halomonas urumqiensis]PTB03077.1 pilus assembly protein PapD [Halomonas urumqiensis]GHE20788.1 fimbria-related chaperone [Halomonas urumqiensis]